MHLLQHTIGLPEIRFPTACASVFSHLDQDLHTSLCLPSCYQLDLLALETVHVATHLRPVFSMRCIRAARARHAL